MHIPDGFLSNRIALGLDVISGASILYAARRVKVEAAGRVVPLMGVLAAFAFAAQLLNFPVLGGTSGHLVGGALLAVVLGPMAGLLTMATVLIAQALFLQDGGLIALGANIFNIGSVTVFGGYAVFRLLGGAHAGGKRLVLASFLAGWASLMLSAVCCALELGLSGAVPLVVGLPAMAGYHAIIGIAEGGLTAGVISSLARVRPDLMGARQSARMGVADWIGAVVLVAIPFAVLLLAGSSDLPDPLQKLLESSPAAPMPEAAAPGLLSFERFRDYAGQFLLFVALAGIGYAATWLTQKWRARR